MLAKAQAWAYGVRVVTKTVLPRVAHRRKSGKIQRDYLSLRVSSNCVSGSKTLNLFPDSTDSGFASILSSVVSYCPHSFPG